MTPEAQRIAIAEACGWQYNPEIRQWVKQNRYAFMTELPDYLSDLNAMHEAEKVQGWHDPNNREADRYLRILAEVCSRSGIPTCFATAAQRAETFLRTIGKWTENAQGSEVHAQQTNPA